MQTKHFSAGSTSELRVRIAPWNGFKPSSKIFLLTVPKRFFFCGSFMLFMSCVCHAYASLVIAALWSSTGKGLTSWLSFVMFNCVLSLSQVVSCVRCGTWLYRFRIVATFLTLTLCLWKKVPWSLTYVDQLSKKIVSTTLDHLSLR